MRIIAGRAKGHRLRGSGRGVLGVRPSLDLVRGSIFSALQSLGVDMSRVLDLYAGSGALGIEALSRGADWCDFVERDRAACRLIADNLRATGLEGQAQVHCLTVERVSKKLAGVYTLVLADPPYGNGGAVATLEAVASSPLVEPGRTVLVLEHSSREKPPEKLGPLSLVNSRRHGDSGVSIYR